jgi:CheY-like chemotaxis protein
MFSRKRNVSNSELIGKDAAGSAGSSAGADMQGLGLKVERELSLRSAAETARVSPTYDDEEAGGIAEPPATYNRCTMQFKDPVMQADFDSFLHPIRKLAYPACSALCFVLGVILLLWSSSVSGSSAAQATAAGVLALLIGVAALALLAVAPNTVHRRGYLLRPSVWAAMMLLGLWGLRTYVHTPSAGMDSTLTVVLFCFILLYVLAMAGIAAHTPLPVVVGVEVLLFLQLLDTNLSLSGNNSSSSRADAGAQALAACTSVVILLFVLGCTCFRMNETCKSFVLFKHVQRAKDQQVRVKIREEAERQKMDYVAQTLHDVGTPLATFALAIENLKASAPVNLEHLETLRTCDCAIELMTLTRRKAIDYAKHYSGKELRPRLGSTNVRELVETKCRRIMSGFNSASMVPIAYNVDPSIAKYIVTDGEFLWECLVNYLSNAVKFTNEGQIQCNVFKLTPDKVRFEVRDTGIGIPHARKQQLFQPFAQLQKFAGGTGLGLWSVKKKVTALRGEVGVHDNPGGGSAFFFDIPYKPDFVLESAMEAQAREAEVAAAELAAARAAEGGTSSAGASLSDAAGGAGSGGRVKRVLLVDNRPATHATAAALLESQGFVLDHASNGFEGLMKMQRSCYTAVLIDYHVTVMDALQVLQKFRDWEDSATAQKLRRGGSGRAVTAAGAAAVAAAGGKSSTGSSGSSSSSSPALSRQFICVMFSDNIHLVELNAAINSGADAVWTDPIIPTAKDIVMMLEDERKTRPPGAPPPLGGTAAGNNSAAAAAAPAAERRTDGCVLLIEDELSILKFEKRMFELHGFEVHTATNGEEGLQKMKKRPYDAVFTDIVMPVMDGYETVRQFRQWESSAAGKERKTKQVVYAVSANASEQDHTMAHMVGMDGFASKPVKVKELVELVRRRTFQ